MQEATAEEALAAPLAAFFREPRFSAVFLSFSIALIPEAATAPLIAERRRALDFRLAAIRRMAARGIGVAVGVGCALAGLGAGDAAVERVEVRWPSGTVQTLQSPALDRVHRVKEP